MDMLFAIHRKTPSSMGQAKATHARPPLVNSLFDQSNVDNATSTKPAGVAKNRVHFRMPEDSDHVNDDKRGVPQVCKDVHTEDINVTVKRRCGVYYVLCSTSHSSFCKSG